MARHIASVCQFRSFDDFIFKMDFQHTFLFFICVENITRQTIFHSADWILMIVVGASELAATFPSAISKSTSRTFSGSFLTFNLKVNETN